MVSINIVIKKPDGHDYVEGACLSTDTKPTCFAVGSIMIAVDTGKVYMWSGSAWVEELSLQG